MCYSILYRAMFIKMKDGSYIPMTEAGDSNVWEANNKRRARDWESTRWNFETDEQKNRYSLSAEEILELAQKQVDITVEHYDGQKEPYSDRIYTKDEILKDLGYFTSVKVSGHSQTSASQFMGFFRSGLRNAVTVEDMKAEGCRFRLSWWKESHHYAEFASTEEELAEKWDECLSKGFRPHVGLTAASERVWEAMKERNRKAKAPRAPRKKPSAFYVIAFHYSGCDRYVVQLTSRNMKFNPFADYAHKYSSRKVAEKASESIMRRFDQVSNVRVECVCTPA